MEGVGSSGRLVGSISTYAGAYKCRWSLVMAQNPRREFFTVYGRSIKLRIVSTSQDDDKDGYYDVKA